MKKNILILVVIIFQSCLLFAAEKDSTYVTEEDSLNVLQQNAELIKDNQVADKWLYWTGVVGLGSTLGSAYNLHWSKSWHNGPVVSLGLELSFNQSRSFNLEMYNFIGFFKLRADDCDDCQFINSVKIHDDNYISIVGLMFGINFNIISFLDNKIKLSGNLDIPIFPVESGDCNLEFINYGINIIYHYSTDISYSLSGRRMFEISPYFGDPINDDTPNLFMLNCYFNF